MHSQIIVNLPIANMARSRAFFEGLGYAFNTAFSNDQGAMLVLGENINAMLMVQDFFQSFTEKPLSDPKTSVDGWVCLTCESREQVDDLVAKAIVGGGTAPGEPKDYGFMYGHGFEDLDGHHWQLIFMAGPPPQA